MTDELDASTAAGAPPGMDVRLSSNEAPLGPSEAAVRAVRGAAPDAHRYPDDQSVALRDAIADHEGVEAAQVAVGTGSAGLLMDVVAHECVDADEPAVVAYERAFVVYRLAAANARAAYVQAPTAGPATLDRDGYARQPEGLLDAVDGDTAVVMIDNPGNPTGAHLSREQLSAVLDGLPRHVTVVVDEAYHHFAAGQRGYATVGDLDHDHPRVLVTRTFSKAYGLAGLRVGYLLGPEPLVRSIDAWRVRFNVNAPAQRAAAAALADREHLERTVAGTLEGRTRMAAGLRELSVPVSEGLGNFVTLELGGPAPPVVAAYAEHGVGVRPLAPYGMHEQIRVTIGTPRDVDAFLAASEAVLGAGASGDRAG